MVYLEIGVRFGKNNSNITILFPNKLELEGEIKYV